MHRTDETVSQFTNRPSTPRRQDLSAPEDVPFIRFLSSPQNIPLGSAPGSCIMQTPDPASHPPFTAGSTIPGENATHEAAPTTASDTPSFPAITLDSPPQLSSAEDAPTTPQLHDLKVVGLLGPSSLPVPQPAHGQWPASSRRSKNPGRLHGHAPMAPKITHLTEDKLQNEKHWERYRDRREMRGGGSKIVWYQTCGPFMLAAPPPSLVANVDEIFIHHDRTSRAKMWVVNSHAVWVSVRAGDRQPSNDDRRLLLWKSSEPSWVKKSSYSVTVSRVKKSRLEDFLES